ncbi:ABC transporter permease [Dehalococcoidia bacterium]|nr:ABC transporter permease [Dehalococcoidia bacterium]MCL0073331.1 ABC transporter permease [Dehalococcoidia bacterium]MCL0102402.1 ABC transporter permease [Dehalococcoidia bacterium]
MNLYLRELRKNRTSLLVWAAIIAGLLLLYTSMFLEVVALWDVAKDLFPEPLLLAFGLDRVDMTTILGFYAMDSYITVILLGSIYAILLSSGILAKEEKDKTIEFLLAKPLVRSSIITGKLLVWFTNIAVLNVLISITAFISFRIFAAGHEYNRTVFLFLLVAPFLAQITFASVGFLAAAIIKKGKSLTAICLSIVLVTFFFNKIAGAADRFKFLEHFTPFHYADSVDIVYYETINPGYLILMLAITSVCIGGAYLSYNRKDMIL